MDTRLLPVHINGQEILTADKVSLRINFTFSYRVTDPLAVITKFKDHEDQLYALAQLALRDFCGRVRLDDLLRQKDSIAASVLEAMQAQQAAFFVTFQSAGIKDIILPGDVRDIMNAVLIAEKNAQASVITRREETAATKSLLETAKLMDENQTLCKLKELEALERICANVGNLSLGSGNVLEALRALLR